MSDESNPLIGKVIPSFDINNDILDKAAKYVMDSVSSYESARDSQVSNDTNRKSWRTRLIQADRAYRGILENSRSYKGFDDKCAPIIHDNVEAIVARLVEAILPNDTSELVEVEVGKNSQPVEKQLAKLRTIQLNDQLEKQNVRKKIERFCRCAVKFGDGFIKVPLINQENKILTQQLVIRDIQTPIIDDNNQPMLDANGQPMVHVEQSASVEVVPEVDKKYFGPGYEVIDDIERLYMDPLIEDIQDQPIIVHEIFARYEDLLQGVENGIYFADKVAEIKEKGTDNRFRGIYYETRKEEVRGSTGNLNFGSGNSKDGLPKPFRLFEGWADFEIEVGEGKDKQCQIHKVVISVINNTCIGIRPNPFFHQEKPFIRGSYRLIEGEAYAISAIDPVLELFHTYCDTMNQIHDGNVLALNPIKIARTGQVADQQDFPIMPGVTWYEKEQGDIRFASMSFPMAEGQQYLELLEQRINRGMGITPLLMGTGDSTDLDKTWRGTNKIISQADKKFRFIAKNLEDAGIKQWGEMGYKVNEQFFPEVDQIGDAFKKINSEINFKVSGVDNWFEKQENIQNYSTFVAQFGMVPGINVAGVVNAIADMQNIVIDEAKYGPLYSPPQPLPEPKKPLNVSVTIPLDSSKGKFQTMAAQQLLNEQYGLQLDYMANKEAQMLDDEFSDPEVEAKSGTLPPSYDSYGKNDKRSKKVINLNQKQPK